MASTTRRRSTLTGRPIDPGRPIRRDEIGDELPLLVGHVAVCRSPGLRHCNRVGLHGKRYAITDPEEGYLPNEVH